MPVVTNNFVRGGVTGLGLVNVFAGFADLALVFASRPSNQSTHADLVDGAEPRDVSGRS